MSYEEEQEMEIEALFAILMDDIKEVEPSEANLKSSSKCFQIDISPVEGDDDEPTELPARLALYFSHTPKYPDEVPLISVRSLKGVLSSDTAELQAKLEEEAKENVGMAMIYTLVTSAKEWLIGKYGRTDNEGFDDDGEAQTKEEVIVPHGLPVTLETFNEWREAFEAELALEKAKLLSDNVISSTKEKKMTGRQWFESGRHLLKGAARMGPHEVQDEEEEEEFDEDFDDEDDDDLDEDEMFEHYLAAKETSQS